MGQVLKSTRTYPYLLIGNGRLARHFRHYLQLLGIPHRHWYRQLPTPITATLRHVEKAIVCLPDDAIADFIHCHRSLNPHIRWIHCSGSLSLPEVESAHPLMTFGSELYSREVYESIWFITEAGRTPFSELLPELPNPARAIPADRKSYYHAWASLAGNFTTLLWQNYFQRLHDQLDLPPAAAEPYLRAIATNLLTGGDPLTGPLARGDRATIEKHRRALQNDPFRAVYDIFVEIYSTLDKPRGSQS
ncbi:MAG: DUF2520 domain-containing protein [Candidatus Neomarinimicrobiota bacterium]